MIFERYRFPLPNNGDRYDFSQDELVKLLDSVYERGYTHGVDVTNKIETTVACSNKSTVSEDWQAYVDAVGGFGVINQAIDEIKLLEPIMDTYMYPDSVYDGFRKEMCARCMSKKECLQSQVDIVKCPFFGNYYEKYKENTK